MSTKFSRRQVLSFFALTTLTGCAPHELQRSLSAANRALQGDLSGAASSLIPTSGVPLIDQVINQQINNLMNEIKKHWNDGKIASEKEYVKYTNDYFTRAIVNFDKGFVRVETKVRKNYKAELNQAIITTLLTPDNPSTIDLLSDKAFNKSSGEPFLYQLVIDHEKQYIRYEWRAKRFADYLLNNNYQSNNTTSWVDFNLINQYQTQQQHKFENFVMLNAKRFNQSPSLIYAIMEAESSFNPYAMSHIPAYGLMQIVPTTAGRDVYQLLYGKAGTPSRDYLLVPENNIRMGVAYLHILDTRYLKLIDNELSREFCVIAAYNTGSGNVLKAFDNNRSNAISSINRLSPNDVYHHLVKNLPYRETRNYLPKVVQLKNKYRHLG